MNNPFDYTPDASCEDAFRELTRRIEQLKASPLPEDINLCRELEGGKMLGVLIASDDSGTRHTLYAFSGQLGDSGFHHRDFVEPVFDYLQPDGYFKTCEADIVRQNHEIALFENGPFTTAKINYLKAEEKANARLASSQEKCRLSKAQRQAQRESGVVSEDELAAMTRQSQFEKAELRRLKKRLSDSLAPLAEELKTTQSQLEALKEKRRSDSEALQKWLFSNFKLLNARGESRSLDEIFAGTALKVPPSGAGECCAPKLLQAAYLRGWHPISITEYWYGAPKGGELRIHGHHYPACRGKCLPVLGWMLQGLSVDPPMDTENHATIKYQPEIIYENEWFCVVNKPSGMLSVPGKGSEISVEQWLTERYGRDRQVKMAHRLDQDTSGLLVATFGQRSFKTMQTLFATREVKKTYLAELEGDYTSRRISQCGCINLPLSPDWLDRPRQRVDLDNGKEAVTDYEFVGVTEGRSRIKFHPLTGRTHQLRVHAASQMGLGMPIAGDRLYGNASSASRLLLHAHKIDFVFPIDGKHYSFESPLPF